ncbi:hypothetical protein L3X39_11350 [Sabulilitoribacter multivorans]|uniref:Uncharacterized protein n=1 Tax=Flaviramulus multivorans TaxID=1304750 RepID=A0ABS9IKX0_9FLAO|nr:hypothetical protein [Flaviramulus multivorans]MCF7561233.1 hypothetical protein [Flaviramulus multivorans]
MKKYFLFTGFVISFFALTSFSVSVKDNNSMQLFMQETQVVTAVFDGHEDYGYNFISTRDDEEYTITFQKVDEAVLSAFNLNLDTFIGTKFKITYTTEIIVTKDGDGYEDEEEINTITKLEKL